DGADAPRADERVDPVALAEDAADRLEQRAVLLVDRAEALGRALGTGARRRCRRAADQGVLDGQVDPAQPLAAEDVVPGERRAPTVGWHSWGSRSNRHTAR